MHPLTTTGNIIRLGEDAPDQEEADQSLKGQLSTIDPLERASEGFKKVIEALEGTAFEELTTLATQGLQRVTELEAEILEQTLTVIKQPAAATAAVTPEMMSGREEIPDSVVAPKAPSVTLSGQQDTKL